MAKKKSSKKSSAKPVRKASKPAKKPAAKKPQTMKKAAPASMIESKAMGGPFPVSTGKGPSVLELANRLVEYFNAGDETSVHSELWADSVCSCEGYGAEMEWRGRPAVIGKNNEWMRTHTIHGARAEGPFVGATSFAVRFEMDVEDTDTGKRQVMREVGVYTVRDGRIVREEFMYGMG
jgi:hypothetical protein